MLLASLAVSVLFRFLAMFRSREANSGHTGGACLFPCTRGQGYVEHSKYKTPTSCCLLHYGSRGNLICPSAPAACQPTSPPSRSALLPAAYFLPSSDCFPSLPLIISPSSHFLTQANQAFYPSHTIRLHANCPNSSLDVDLTCLGFQLDSLTVPAEMTGSGETD